ncbi:MAG TPA: S41 family peptidase [Terrimicrobiaceae bacterium]|nr:S41 family peptidase [Terrimicrobiaceae bacterium]
MILRVFLLLAILMVTLRAQEPSPSPSPVAEPSASPSPTPTPAPTPTPTPRTTRDLINGLNDDDVEKALQTFKEGFFDGSKVDEREMKRATLEGVVRRLSPGAAIVSASTKSAPHTEIPFLVEILDSHIAYFRLGALTKDTLAQFDAALASFSDKDIDAVILDLRGLPDGGDYETAAEFARRFCPKGKMLFSIQKPSAKQERIFTSNQDPAFQGVVVLLTDFETSGAAEALAGTLRLNAGAMIIGSETTGEAVEFAEAPIGGNAVLRVAVAQVILPNSGPIFPDGLKPDVSISLPREVRDQIFRESKEKGVSQFVFDPERRRMNEASLVANLNPEIEAMQVAQRDRGKAPQVRDTVLQRAVDLVTAINFYKGKKQ